jgi:hypothetical protein
MRPASTITAMPAPATVSSARVHLLGAMLLALLLQALSPLLHARLQALAADGRHIAVAAFCLPGQSAPPTPADREHVPVPADCLLCQGGTAPAADLPTPPRIALPPTLVGATPVAEAPSRTAAFAPSRAHRPRAPPRA